MQTSWSVIIITIIAAFIMTRLSQARSSSGQCMLGGQNYMVGDTWQPSLNTLRGKDCVNCTCLPGGDVQCVGVECPRVECEEPRVLEGQCCPTCEVRREEDGDDVTEPPGCDFDGSHYENGETFPSNKTAIKPNNDSQCVLCACMRQEVICHLKTCPKCRKSVHVEDDCCPHCEEKGRLDVFSPIPPDNVNQTLGEGECYYPNGRQSNGSTWKPVIGQYGEMPCIVCTCLNGQVNCSRLQCPEESSLTCESPSIDKWGCCKMCPKEEKKRRRKKKGRKRRCKKTSTADGKTSRVCKRRRSKKKQNRRSKTKDKGKVIFTDAMKLDDVIHRLCMPRKTQKLVYHTKGEDFESLAFDGPSDNTIEHIHWTIKKGRVQDTEREMILETEQFRQNLTVADILGAVKIKDIKRFLKRLDKRQKRCKKKCRRKLLDRCIKKMKTIPVDRTKSCAVSNEND